MQVFKPRMLRRQPTFLFLSFRNKGHTAHQQREIDYSTQSREIDPTHIKLLLIFSLPPNPTRMSISGPAVVAFTDASLVGGSEKKNTHVKSLTHYRSISRRPHECLYISSVFVKTCTFFRGILVTYKLSR